MPNLSGGSSAVRRVMSMAAFPIVVLMSADAHADAPTAPDVIFVVNGSVSSGGVFGITPSQTIPFTSEGPGAGWDATVSYTTGSMTSTASAADGTLSGTVTGLLDMTPMYFSGSDEFDFGANIAIYVRGCSQGYTFDYSASGTISVAHPEGCSGTWGPHGVASWTGQSVGSSTTCADGTQTVAQTAGYSGVSAGNTTTFVAYPGVPYGLAASQALSAQVFESDGAHLFDNYRRIVASVNVTFTVSVSLAPTASPPIAAFAPGCALCSRFETIPSLSYDPDDGTPPPYNAGIQSLTWDFAPPTWFTTSGTSAIVRWPPNAGGYAASLSVTDGECETASTSMSVDVKAPKAAVFNLAHSGVAGVYTDCVANAVGEILRRKGWRTVLHDPTSILQMCNLLQAEGPCLKGVVIISHGANWLCDAIVEEGTGTWARPADVAGCFAGKELEFLQMVACNVDGDYWAAELGVPRAPRTIGGRIPNPVGCVGWLASTSECRRANRAMARGLDPYGFPEACLGSASVAGELRRANDHGGETRIAGATCGAILACDESGVCGESHYPALACAEFEGIAPEGGTIVTSVPGDFSVRVVWPGGCADTSDVEAHLFGDVPAGLKIAGSRQLPRYLWVDGSCGEVEPESLLVTIGYADSELLAAGIDEDELRPAVVLRDSGGIAALTAEHDTAANTMSFRMPSWGLVQLGTSPVVTVMNETPPVSGHGPRIVAVMPNPVVHEATVAFEARDPGLHRVRIYDISGRLVAEVFNREVQSGRHSVSWTTARGQAMGGVFFIEIRGPRGTHVRRIVVLR